jgi:multidrug efflux pump subunit AcrA (membrane-fusion protein)
VLRLGWVKLGVGILAVLLLVSAAVVMTRGSAVEPLPSTAIRSVEVKSVAELSNETSPLSVVGQVSSKSEATVRAERSGQIVGVYKSLGDTIAAGVVAAELENASERAAVLQAQGAVEAAEANLSKITGGARSEQLSILESNLASASASLIAARASAVNAILSAFAAGDNAISGTTDKMFTNPRSNSPIFNVTSTDSQLTNKIENTRTVVGPYLSRQAFVSDGLTPASDLGPEISRTETEVRAMRNFVDLIINNLNKGIPTSAASEIIIASYLADATAARTSLTTALSSLSGATQGIVSAGSAVEVAK